jgi:hypothetical protein
MAVTGLLGDYGGDVALMSFNSIPVAACQTYAPNTLRGILLILPRTGNRPETVHQAQRAIPTRPCRCLLHQPPMISGLGRRCRPQIARCANLLLTIRSAAMETQAKDCR